MSGEVRMKREELKKEAEEKANAFCKENKLIAGSEILRFGSAFERGYLASAEPREKQIQIDAEQIRALQKQNGELTDKVKKLEAQIEKMKCCGNCDFVFRDGNCYYDKECKNKDHWKLRR
jgi:cell division protein FtsB